MDLAPSLMNKKRDKSTKDGKHKKDGKSKKADDQKWK